MGQCVSFPPLSMGVFKQAALLPLILFPSLLFLSSPRPRWLFSFNHLVLIPIFSSSVFSPPRPRLPPFLSLRLALIRLSLLTISTAGPVESELCY